MEKIRPTISNARKGKDGVFLPEHLDSEKGKAAQMDGLLAVWNCYMADGGWRARQDFSQVEDFFYKVNFADGLAYQNAKYKKKGNYDRIRDMDEYRKSVKTCPESSLYYLGDMYHNAGAEKLRVVVSEFLAWRAQKYPQVVALDWALHIEKGAPHIHERHVCIGHDEAGNPIVCQEKALEEMGVPRADEAKYQVDMAAARKIKDKKERAQRISQINRYNNRKMTYTETCRNELIRIARSHGIEVEDKPREAGRKNRSQAAYITQDEQRKAQEARQARDKMEAERDEMEQERDAMEQEKVVAMFDRNKTELQVASLEKARGRLQDALQGDLRAVEVQEAKQGAVALLGALGASAEVHAVRVEVPRNVTPGPVAAAVRSRLAQQVIAMDERRRGINSGLPSVEGPTV